MLCLQVSNQDSLKAAVDAAAAFLNKAVKPVLVAGGHLRSEKAMGAFAGEAPKMRTRLTLLTRHSHAPRLLCRGSAAVLVVLLSKGAAGAALLHSMARTFNIVLVAMQSL